MANMCQVNDNLLAKNMKIDGDLIKACEERERFFNQQQTQQVTINSLEQERKNDAAFASGNLKTSQKKKHRRPALAQKQKHIEHV